MKVDVRNQLLAMAEPKYQQFTSKLLPGITPIIGIRLPALRKIAKKLSKEYGVSALELVGIEYFEELMLRGFIIGYLKEEIGIILEEVRNFIPLINNWSVCDSFCSSLKIAKTEQAEMWNFLQPYFVSSHEFEVRFALVMCIFYYLEEDYLEPILKRIDHLYCEDYYVKMAVAWLLSMYYVKQQERIEEYLEQATLDSVIYQKTLQKIIESHQISEETRDKIRRKKQEKIEK